MFEKKRGKRFLASVMALVMLLSLAPVGALAADETTTEESPAVAQSAVEGKDQQAEDTNENTPTEPTKDSDSAEATKSEGGLDESFSADPDDADTSNDIAVQDLSLSNSTREQSITAEFWLTNRHAEVDNVWTMDITKAMVGNDGTAVTDLAPAERRATADETYDTVFWQARVLSNQQRQTTANDDDKTASGTEIDSIRFQNNEFQYHDKNGNSWKSFNSSNDQLVFYYLIRTDYSQMVQIDVSDWTVNDEPSSEYPSHRGVTYQVIVDGSNDDGKVLDSKTFWYNRDLTVSAIRVRQTQSDNYTISKVELTPNNLGTVVEENGEYQFSLNLKNANTAEATVKIYVSPNVQPKQLSYQLNGGTITSNASDYTVAGEVYPDAPVVTPSVSKEDYTFDGWYTDAAFMTEWTGTTMPNENLMLHAKWTGNSPVDPTPDPTPDADLVDAMYFVLMPGQGVPNSGVSRGVDKYFPNASNNGGVTGKSNTTGYEGKITKAATELTGANTSNGYFNKNGVGDQYLKDIGDLGYFNGSNYTDGKYKDTLPDGLKDFNMTNKEIVWYVIKKEGNDYHVDGYVKGVNIELKYFDEFDGTQIGETTSLLSGGTATIKNPDVTHDGWKFAGWFTKDGTKYEVNSTHTLIDSLNLYARWTTTYSVVTHFMGANGIEQENLSQTSNNLTGTHGKLLSELVVQPDMENITGNYVYVPSETKYSVGNGDKVPVGTTTFTTANTVIHQYYYLDETGETGKDKENKPTDKPDGIPDAWQHKVTFKVVNGKWNDDSSDNIVVYVNAKDKNGKTLDSKLTEAQIPVVGEKPNSGYRASGSWDKSLSADLKITGDTEFTFTYSRRSSGGSSRPSTPPTVDIPDDVPTGLNGKDHYAYIIGYGNNDVRPQNNITRAEVATIFFRLLTDETRTANMTKSNGYNDVKDGDWFCCAVSTLSKMGIIKGYEDGSFKPNDPISRAEFAAIAARFDPDGDKTPATFADVTSHWAKDEISIAANHGWIKGYEDGYFKPDQKITRAETMTLVNRVLNRLPETKDDLHKDMKTWVDNMDETAWYYLAVQEATNSHYFKNKTSTKFEQWTDLRDTRDWSELEK